MAVHYVVAISRFQKPDRSPTRFCESSSAQEKYARKPMYVWVSRSSMSCACQDALGLLEVKLYVKHGLNQLEHGKYFAVIYYSCSLPDINLIFIYGCCTVGAEEMFTPSRNCLVA